MKCDVMECEKEGTAKAAGPILWWLCDEHRPASTVDDYSWNAALEAAALKAEEEAAALRADLPAFSSTAGVMDAAEAVALESFAKTIRSLKRGQL